VGTSKQLNEQETVSLTGLIAALHALMKLCRKSCPAVHILLQMYTTCQQGMLMTCADCTDIQKSMAIRLMMAVLTGVLGRDLGVLTDIVLARGDMPLLNLGVRLPLLLAFRLLTGLKTLQQVHAMLSC